MAARKRSRAALKFFANASPWGVARQMSEAGEKDVPRFVAARAKGLRLRLSPAATAEIVAAIKAELPDGPRRRKLPGSRAQKPLPLAPRPALSFAAWWDRVLGKWTPSRVAEHLEAQNLPRTAATVESYVEAEMRPVDRQPAMAKKAAAAILSAWRALPLENPAPKKRLPDPPAAVRNALRLGARDGCDFCEGRGWGRSTDYGDVPEPCAKCFPELWKRGKGIIPKTAAGVPIPPGRAAAKLEDAKGRRAAAKAARAYRRVHWGHAGDGAAPKASIVNGDHGTLVVLGELASATYETTKGGDRARPALWRHDFEGSRPLLVFHDCDRPGCAEKGKMTIAGGTYRVTTRGIVG